MARHTVDLAEHGEERLANLATKGNTTKSDIIRRALALYSLVQDETQSGEKQLTISMDDEVIKEIVLP